MVQLGVLKKFDCRVMGPSFFAGQFRPPGQKTPRRVQNHDIQFCYLRPRVLILRLFNEKGMHIAHPLRLPRQVALAKV